MPTEWVCFVQIHNPAGEWHLYKLPPSIGSQDEAIGPAIDVAKAAQGVPVDWEPPWDVSLQTGDPAPSQLARSILHDWSAGIP